MDSTETTVHNGKESMVDPFLVEALQDPRHRLTILRMELDIQRFFHAADQQQFEFQHFPSSYLRLAAHRVAQHYGMQTMVQDSCLDGKGNRILVKKTGESKYPVVRLSEIPAKQTEKYKLEHKKIVLRPRPNKVYADGGNEGGLKSNHLRSVEERKEEYDKARARIFSSPSSSVSGDVLHEASKDGKNICLNGEEDESYKKALLETEATSSIRDGVTSSRVAILRDREKDRTDPDYDRSYERYMRNLSPNQSFSLGPYNMQTSLIPLLHYETDMQQLGEMPRSQAPVNYRPPSNTLVDPFCAVGNPTSRDATYMQWPSSAMYAYPYEQFRHGVFQVPFYQQQPLSFNYSQNH